jgi:hypothetical protein
MAYSKLCNITNFNKNSFEQNVHPNPSHDFYYNLDVEIIPLHLQLSRHEIYIGCKA